MKQVRVSRISSSGRVLIGLMGLVVLSSGVLGLSNIPAAATLGLCGLLSLGGILMRGRISRPSLFILLFLTYNLASGVAFGGISSVSTEGLLSWIGNEGRMFLYFWPLIFVIELFPKKLDRYPSAIRNVMRFLAPVSLILVQGPRLFDLEFFSTNHAAGTFCTALLIFHYFHYVKSRSTSDLFFLAISLVALLGTNSRTSLLAFGFAVFLTSLLDGRGKQVISLIALSLLGFLVMSVLFQSQFERFTDAASGDTISAVVENFSLAATGGGNFEVENAFAVSSLLNLEGDGNLAIRGILWGRAFREGVMSPVVGIGFGRYNDVGRIFTGVPYVYYPVGSAALVSASDFTAHNSILHIFAELGLLGILSLAVIFISLWKRFSVDSKSVDKNLDHWRYIGRANLLTLLFMGMTQHSFGAPIYGMTLMLLVGIAYRMVGYAATAPDNRSGAPTQAAPARRSYANP